MYQWRSMQTKSTYLIKVSPMSHGWRLRGKKNNEFKKREKLVFNCWLLNARTLQYHRQGFLSSLLSWWRFFWLYSSQTKWRHPASRSLWRAHRWKTQGLWAGWTTETHRNSVGFVLARSDSDPRIVRTAAWKNTKQKRWQNSGNGQNTHTVSLHTDKRYLCMQKIDRKFFVHCWEVKPPFEVLWVCYPVGRQTKRRLPAWCEVTKKFGPFH